mmetsp:Transcript_70187/g.196453  ORF Transcript_70187/g.196453 Transcript_70187/m.196453 type:complete len:261 (+) Transcript_70187:141-923(+)|eukprot:CAMPEP_0119503832 /NCGR_PEP_ID=MMETSP1344-20130328/24877_1 /TAXON_ID=236787 /ORGANISM="Florenciella parvula, Strain CCMP2471" /LENGTH=260 /DNA_ID=CAMNT_0007540157 /DNA_START=119 /DNA_END=901 /DNA_ORIENTATION=-
MSGVENSEDEESDREQETPPPPPPTTTSVLLGGSAEVPPPAAPAAPGSAPPASTDNVVHDKSLMELVDDAIDAKKGGVDMSVERTHHERVINDTVKQQLRGIFAAHDHDHDHMITRAQLVDVMSMIGLKATDKLIQKFYAARPKNAGPSLIDLNTFLAVASEQLLEAQDVTPELIELFEVFDPPAEDGSRSGMVTLKTLRHIMLEVLTPDRLTRAEFEEFITVARLKSEGYGMEDQVKIDYRSLVNNLLIGKPRMNMRVS